jgi:hypothetical protein
MKDKEEKSDKFWSWFNENNRKYLFINQVDEDEREILLDEFINKLHEYNENLFFEIGGHPEDINVELIITAEGVIEYFDDVEWLVEKSPNIKGWKIIAFKPPMGTGFKTKYRNFEFDPKTIIFIPLDHGENPRAIGIRICFPEFEEDLKDIFTNGSYLMLDVLLGEKSVALDINYLDVVRTPDDIGDYPFLHLSEIQEYIKEKKNGS